VVSTGLDAAYASCEQMARAHYENFPVASVLLPAHMRRHVAAVYAFARAADDFADEGERPAAERLELLDHWGRRLDLAVSGIEATAVRPGEPPNTVSIFNALGATIRACELPVGLLHDLLSAFRQDVTVTRYQNWELLLDYCRRSANPVGRLVLRIAGYRDDRLDRCSDAICTALQLTNFWQDLQVDAARGRVYLPQSELILHGTTGDRVGAAIPAVEIRRAVHAAAERTRRLFVAGRPLCDAVGGRLRYELRATWLGGMRILDRVERRADKFDRPTLSYRDAPWLAWRMATWALR
jgi:hydroxysqualene synthase